MFPSLPKFSLSIALVALVAWTCSAEWPVTSVSFRTSDARLQRLFDAAEAKAATNIVQFTPTMKILVEGGGYENAWIETQPMGGEMYAKRNIDIALNNQVIFMQSQRADGRFPGMIVSGFAARKSGQDQNPPWDGMVWRPELDILASYDMLQGYCFPDPAWKMYFWSGKDRAYLRKLYAALEAHDGYLWRTRDSNGDGLLESWCTWDTGEDNSARLMTRFAPTRWPFELPPNDERMPDPKDGRNFKKYWLEYERSNVPSLTREQVLMPFASMDLMAYSYDGRSTLAKISRELGNNRETFWLQRAEEVRQRLIKGLWDEQRHACFDRDRTGKRLEELVHNNLRAMYYGVYTQPMADAFIRHHVLNPAEFWTPTPLPSIAFNEPLYSNKQKNNWGGQPQGLTYQRAIRALENYGHYAEVSLLGDTFLSVLLRNGGTFFSQFDPTTGVAAGLTPDGYGPSILAALEYISRMHGIHLDVANDRIWWSALNSVGTDFSYTQRWGEQTWMLTCSNGQFTARCSGRDIFSCTAGVRVMTTFAGKVQEVAGIDSVPQSVTLRTDGNPYVFTIAPNQIYQLDGQKVKVLHTVPFDYPRRK